MRYQSTHVSLENDETLPQEDGIQFQEPENPFLDTLTDETPESQTPEQIEVAIAEDASEVVEVATVVEDVSIAVESLEAIALHLTQLKNKGKAVSVESVALLNIGVENAVRKFPAFKKTTTVDSLENFTINPADATTVSLENIGDKIKAGYDAVVKFLKDLWEKFKAFLGNILSGAAIAEKNARKNMEDVKTANTSKRAEGEIKIPAVLNNPVLTKAAIDNLTKVVGSIGMVSYRDLISNFEKIQANGSVPLEFIKESLNKVFDAYGRMSDNAYLGNLSFKNDQFPPSINMLEAEARQAKPLTIAQVKEFTTANIQLCGAITQLKKTLAERGKAIAHLSAQIELIARRLNKTGDDENIKNDAKHTPAEIMTYLRTTSQLLNKVNVFETKVLGRSVQVANAINKVCADSIKAHG